MINNEIIYVASKCKDIRDNIERVIVGKSSIIELLMVSILCEGHILLEDVPGIGKTMLARSMARSLKCSFNRIQCTPDLLPSDITGTHIYNQKTCEFEFKPGPVFAQVVLADEINRATPRSQSALLESMEERQVTLEGETRKLPRPFIVLATQNPVELEGTFPLPEAQMDRFMMRLALGYPSEKDDELILERFCRNNPIDDLQPVVDSEEVAKLQNVCRLVIVSDDIRKYIISIVHTTRQQKGVDLGASPRAMLGLFRTSQALAAIRGRNFVIPDDVKYLAPYVLAHRIITQTSSSLKGHTGTEVINNVLEDVPAPVETEPQTVTG